MRVLSPAYTVSSRFRGPSATAIIACASAVSRWSQRLLGDSSSERLGAFSVLCNHLNVRTFDLLEAAVTLTYTCCIHSRDPEASEISLILNGRTVPFLRRLSSSENWSLETSPSFLPAMSGCAPLDGRGPRLIVLAKGTLASNVGVELSRKLALAPWKFDGRSSE